MASRQIRLYRSWSGSTLQRPIPGEGRGLVLKPAMLRYDSPREPKPGKAPLTCQVRAAHANLLICSKKSSPSCHDGDSTSNLSEGCFLSGKHARFNQFWAKPPGEPFSATSLGKMAPREALPKIAPCRRILV